MARAISKILFILGSYNFLAYLECVRSYAWSKGHSDPDLSSVNHLQSHQIQQLFIQYQAIDELKVNTFEKTNQLKLFYDFQIFS